MMSVSIRAGLVATSEDEAVLSALSIRHGEQSERDALDNVDVCLSDTIFQVEGNFTRR